MKARLFVHCLAFGVAAGIAVLAAGEDWVHFGLAGKTVNSIAVDPTDPDIIFAAAEEGLYKTTNAGVSWDTLGPGLLYGLKAITIDPANPLLLYTVHGIGDWNDGIYRSTDGGLNWEVVYRLVYGTSLFADSSAVLLAGALNDLNGGGVHLSTDGGATWDTVNQGLTNLDVLSVGRYAFADSISIALAGTRGGIFRMTYLTPPWSYVGPSVNAFIFSLAGFNDDLNLYAAFGGGSWSDGVYKSTDSGETWQVSHWLIHTEALAVNPLNHAAVYGGSNGYGVIRSTNGGYTWGEMNQGLTDLNVKELAFSRTDTTYLYAGTEGGGVFRYGLVVGVEEQAEHQSPISTLQLMQNVPNPFTQSTTIRYNIASAVSGRPTAVSLAIYDLSGRLVRTLVDQPYNYGTIQLCNRVIWDGRDDRGGAVASSIYFCRLTVYPALRPASQSRGLQDRGKQPGGASDPGLPFPRYSGVRIEGSGAEVLSATRKLVVLR